MCFNRWWWATSSATSSAPRLSVRNGGGEICIQRYYKSCLMESASREASDSNIYILLPSLITGLCGAFGCWKFDEGHTQRTTLRKLPTLYIFEMKCFSKHTKRHSRQAVDVDDMDAQPCGIPIPYLGAEAWKASNLNSGTSTIIVPLLGMKTYPVVDFL